MNSRHAPAPTNVRFDSKTRRRLAEVARRHHLTVSNLVRAAVHSQLDEWERNGVRFNTNEGQ